jgi:hypothetical protein
MDRVKVRFPLSDDPLGVGAEWMWAKPLEGLIFELDNAPLHAYEISVEDVFLATISDSVVEFRSVVRKSGWRTVRVKFSRGKTHQDFEAIWPPLQAMGCEFEGAQSDRPLYAISVPCSASLSAVIDYLSSLEQNGVLEYEEADCF